MKSYAKILALILALGQVIVWSGGCGSSQAARGAGEGAALGAVGGAVAGAVGAMIFGGNVAQGAAAGAAMGAASGAATGAMSGAMADSKVKEQQAREQQAAALKEKIGEQNFEAANLLAHCKHRQAIGAAQKAYASPRTPTGACMLYTFKPWRRRNRGMPIWLRPSMPRLSRTIRPEDRPRRLRSSASRGS